MPRSFALAAGMLLAAVAAQPAETETAAFDPVAIVQSVGSAVERIRGLAFQREVSVRVVDDAEARAHFEERAAKLWPAEKIAHDQSALAQLGLLPPGFDLLAGLLDILEEQAGGYYDPETDAFYVLDDIPKETAPILMAHELTHALDDQHYDIEALLDSAEQSDDQSTALAAVVEGSGTVIQALYTAREMQAGRLPADLLDRIRTSEAGQARRLRAAPEYLQRALIVPYTLGPTFALRGDPSGRSSDDLAADLNRLFEHPPTSTEQILHPEKYWDPERRDDPAPLELGDVSATLGPGWALASKGRLGELNLAVLTGGSGPDPTTTAASEPLRWTTAAAAGAVGDVYHHYLGSGGKRVTVLAIIWDDRREADEFLAALLAVPGRRAFQALDRVVLVAGDVEQHAPVAAAAMSVLSSGR